MARVSWGGVLAIGDAFTGIELSFSGCLAGPSVAVLSVNFLVLGPVEGCCRLEVLPHPATGAIQTIDCNGVAHTASGVFCQDLNDSITCALPSPPSDPFPADGATGVDLDANLLWTLHEPDFCPELLYGYAITMHFGTSPTPPAVAVDDYPPYDPGALEPATTYYWRVVQKVTELPAVSSPVWSFTTTAPVATESRTWGAIKALYR